MRFARGQRSIRGMSSPSQYNLEKPAAEMAAYLAQGPGLSELPLEEVRKSIEGAQAGVPMPDVDEAWITVPAEVGDVRVLLIKPRGVDGRLPVVLYMHGGGWMFGSASSHGRLAAELAVASDAAASSSSTRLRPKRSTPFRSSSATGSLDGSHSKARRTASTRHVSRSPVTQRAGTWQRCSASWQSSATT